MLNVIFTFINRRRRFFLVQLVAILWFCMTLLLWSNSQLNMNSIEDDEKLIVPSFKESIDTPKADNSKVKRKESYNSESEKEIRERAMLENRDEFLEPVLKQVQYKEIDLNARRLKSHDDYDQEIEGDLQRIKPGLGDQGENATVPSNQKSLADTIMKKEAFNRLLSDMISYNRSVPDTRESACRDEVYDDDLPNMSVIIIYTNEAFSVLVRTLHSVINRTPPKLVREIILVDDFSDHGDLKGKLERYVATKFQPGIIRLLRLSKRSGLIRAKMIGAHVAVGEVLLFLDAHCEANEKWAEPLLQRIKEDRTVVVCPVIDIIDDKTMEYFHGKASYFMLGGFTWSGDFNWINIPKYEKDRKKHNHSPSKSPTMAGGLFAIDRKYFWEMGSYDSDMLLWGGENLEMSFRIWQCGGSLLTIPCSRVAHIFRDFHPYKFPDNLDSHGLNTARVAEVWMDEYKDLFYSFRNDLRNASWGNVEKRVAFRKRKRCKGFKWYLDNIYKEKFRMQLDARLYGQVKNPNSSLCLDSMDNSEPDEYSLELSPCHLQFNLSQLFLLSNKDELRREWECAKVGNDSDVQMVHCDDLPEIDLWDFNDGQLYNRKSQKCLSIALAVNKSKAVLEPCDNGAKQKWVFDAQKYKLEN